MSVRKSNFEGLSKLFSIQPIILQSTLHLELHPEILGPLINEMKELSVSL